MFWSNGQTFHDIYRRDSFSHRICDDLAEVILQFLPFEDKFRLECVSKLFQRTIFERQYEWVIDPILAFRSKAIYCHKYNERSLSIFINILKKLPKIRCLRQKTFHEILLNDRDLHLITKYCRHLTAIHCDFRQISNTRILAERLPKIVAFSADVNNIQMICHTFPHIQELNCVLHFFSYPLTFSHISKLQLKSLKKLSVEIGENIKQHLTDFQEFVEISKSLTHLTIDLVLSDDIVLEFLFKQISRLTHLIELKVNMRYKVADIWLIDALKQIAINCQNLKSLTFGRIDTEFSETESIFNELKNFKRLQRLSINNIKYDSGIELILNNCLKQMKDLTHFKLTFYKTTDFQIEETLLSDLNQYIPKLRNLVLRNKMQVSIGMADILSRLSYLESIEMNVTDQLTASIIETKIMEKCKRIKSIELYERKIDSKFACSENLDLFDLLKPLFMLMALLIFFLLFFRYFKYEIIFKDSQ